MKESFWRCCSDNTIELVLTKYPVKIDYDLSNQTAQKYNVQYYCPKDLFGNDVITKTFWKFLLDMQGQQERMNCIFCHMFQNCWTLHYGKLYNCSPIYPSMHLNKKYNVHLNNSISHDSIDIYSAESWEELCEFATVIPRFCKYCCVGERTDGYEWRRSGSRKEEWIWTEEL